MSLFGAVWEADLCNYGLVDILTAIPNDKIIMEIRRNCSGFYILKKEEDFLKINLYLNLNLATGEIRPLSYLR
jgi:hypothetical protein